MRRCLQLAASDLQTGIGESGAVNNGLPRRESEPVQVSAVPVSSPLRANSIAPILSREDSDAGDWGGDLMDVNADADDWDSFETGATPEPALSTSVKPKKPSAKTTLANAPPLSTKKVMPSIANTTNGALKLGSSGRTRDNPLLKELGMLNGRIWLFQSSYVYTEAEANEGDDGWDLDGDEVETAPPTRPASTSSGHWNDPPTTHFAGAPRPKTSTTKPKAIRPVQAAEEDSWGLFDDAAAKEEANWDDGQSSWKPTAAPTKPDSKSKMDQMREERKAVCVKSQDQLLTLMTFCDSAWLHLKRNVHLSRLLRRLLVQTRVQQVREESTRQLTSLDHASALLFSSGRPHNYTLTEREIASLHTYTLRLATCQLHTYSRLHDRIKSNFRRWSTLWQIQRQKSLHALSIRFCISLNHSRSKGIPFHSPTEHILQLAHHNLARAARDL